MKILIAGPFEYEFYEEDCVDALRKLGHEVEGFRWSAHFRSFPARLERVYNVHGPATCRMVRSLVAASAAFRPDWILFWRTPQLESADLTAIRRESGAKLATFVNDDPFSPLYHHSPKLHIRRMWKKFCGSLADYDVHFVYRPHNVDDYRAAGAREVHVLPPYFVPDKTAVTLTAGEQERLGSDVLFLGHYEPDGRREKLVALAESDINVKLLGPLWTRKNLGRYQALFGDVRTVRGDEYFKTLRAAKVCLAFFSALNRDPYTRRTFEIPATGSAMLSQRTEHVRKFFAEDKEAVYFSDTAELIRQAHRLISDEPFRQAVAQAGHRRCLSSGYDIETRMREAISVLEQHL